MPSLINLTGLRFGRLTVISIADRNAWKQKQREWLCKCDCDNEITVAGCALRTGNTSSCGCLYRESRSTHGRSRTKEHRAWEGMKLRCLNPSHNSYSDYGGRGITVCDRWLESFENFFADMGIAPSGGHSLDRIDNEKGYSLANCRWALPGVQQSNRRSNVHLTHDGVTLHVAEWARRIGTTQSTLWRRLANGWSHERTLSEPVRPRVKRKSS